MSDAPPDYRALLRQVPPHRGPGLKPGTRRHERVNLTALVREHGGGESWPGTVDLVYSIANDPTVDPRVRLAAIAMLWDRGAGKPPQMLHVEASLSASTGASAEDALVELSDEQLHAAVELASRVARELGLPELDGNETSSEGVITP